MKRTMTLMGLCAMATFSTCLLAQAADPPQAGGMMGGGMMQGNRQQPKGQPPRWSPMMRMMRGEMMGQGMMMSGMLRDQVVPTQDGGVVVVVGNMLLKYDKNLKLVGKTKIDITEQDRKQMMETVRKNREMMMDMFHGNRRNK